MHILDCNTSVLVCCTLTCAHPSPRCTLTCHSAAFSYFIFLGIRSHSTDGYKNLQKWNSIRTANIVTLHTVFTIKAFGDQSIMFVYDYHPAAETLMQRHFTQNHYFGKKRPQRKFWRTVQFPGGSSSFTQDHPLSHYHPLSAGFWPDFFKK